MTVRCPSNGRSASSTSGLLAPAAQSSAGQALRRRQPHTAAEPVNPRSPLRAGFHCRVVPFLGLAIFHRLGALGAAWSMWSTTFHRESIVRLEADSLVHGHSPVRVSRFVRPVVLQIFQDEESFHSAGRKWPISNEKWVVHF